jgi:hypothetical protein
MGQELAVVLFPSGPLLLRPPSVTGQLLLNLLRIARRGSQLLTNRGEVLTYRTIFASLPKVCASKGTYAGSDYYQDRGQEDVSRDGAQGFGHYCL